MAAVRVGAKTIRYANAKGETRKYGRRWTALRAVIADRDDHRCCLCGATDGPHHADHIVPFAHGGGEYDADNLWLLCERCNLRLGAKRKQPAVEAMALQLAFVRNRQ
jgi:5-methylcytosine-specific restriction endonuclease McrA